MIITWFEYFKFSYNFSEKKRSLFDLFLTKSDFFFVNLITYQTIIIMLNNDVVNFVLTLL